jgi:hypothetical protein
MANVAHPSEQVSLNRNVLGTAKGPWLIPLNAVLTAKESDNASLLGAQRKFGCGFHCAGFLSQSIPCGH